MNKVVFKYFPLLSRPTGKKFPILETKIEHGGARSVLPFQSIVDTGADGCLFDATLAEDLNIKVDSVRPVSTGGNGKNLVATFVHPVRLVFDFSGQEFSYIAEVGFVYEGLVAELGIGLLGRRCFMDQIESIKFIQKKELFEIEYENPA